MPPEENQELSDQLATSMEEGAETTSQPFVQDNGQAERLLSTSQGTQQTQQNGQTQQPKKWAGKYNTPEEMEKGYLNQSRNYRPLETKAQQLERLLMNPKVQSQLANDPEAVEILGKLGYELVKEETRQDEQTGGGTWDGNTNSPDFRMAVLEHKQQLYFDRLDFQQELGRRLSEQEWKDIRSVIASAPRLTVRQAWKVTDHYDKLVKEREEKAIAQAQKRPGVMRPRPAQPGSLGGPKPQGKSALGLRDDEKGQFIQDLIDKSERGT